jgi:uncharacterized protein
MFDLKLPPSLVTCLAFAAFALVACTSSHEDPTPAADSGAEATAEDRYVICVLKTGARAPKLEAEESARLQSGHLANITRLVEAEKIVIAGPFGKNPASPNFRGIFVFRGVTIEEARALGATDPAVAAGIFDLEFHAALGDPKLAQLFAMERETAARLAESQPDGPGFEIRGYTMAWLPKGHNFFVASAHAARPEVILDFKLQGASEGQRIIVFDDDGSKGTGHLAGLVEGAGEYAARILSWWASANIARLAGREVQ